MVNATLYLLKYNNYYNRIVKKEDTIDGYIPYQIGEALQRINFNPNDYVSTELIINWDYEHPDYLVVVNEEGAIEHRWFVMDVQRTRAGQFKIVLQRDVIADFYKNVKESTCFIEKGWTSTSPLVFNNENMGFNQIKTKEVLLENSLKTPWLVLYLARYNNEGQYNEFKGTFNDQPTDLVPHYVLDSLDKYTYYAYSQTSNHQAKQYVFSDFDNVQFGALYQDEAELGEYGFVYMATVSKNGFVARGDGGQAVGVADGKQYPILKAGRTFATKREWFGDFSGFLTDGTQTVDGLPINSYTSTPKKIGTYQPGPSNIGTLRGDDLLRAEQNKIIRVGNDYYRITYTTSDLPTYSLGTYQIPKGSGLAREMWGSIFLDNEEAGNIKPLTLDETQEYYLIVETTYKGSFLNIEKIDVSSTPIEYDIKYDTSFTRDASYEILATPLYNTQFYNVPAKSGSSTVYSDEMSNGDIGKQWFQDIINRYNAAGFAYDLQLVPYCPIDKANLESLSPDEITWCYRKLSNSQVNLTFAIKLPNASFQTIVTRTDIPLRDDLKLSNELDLYRLVSPNGIGEYEWSPAKNGSSVSRFEVDCTLIPYNPYIKINPSFANLYGQDFDDYRGLICDGDFSLPIINNQWETYQLNNKYYQAIFDRNIEHQEYNNKFQFAQDIGSAISGSVAGATSGAIAGSAGGPVGAIVGGVVGGVASTAGGIADIAIGQKLRKENIQYQKDQFGFELGTIKARSQTLTRTTSYNINNKYFPYVEYYTCTSEEEKALTSKMKYNGMTIGVIDNIQNYMNPNDYTYIQAQLIEIDITEDYHVAAEINRILQGGIRIA